MNKISLAPGRVVPAPGARFMAVSRSLRGLMEREEAASRWRVRKNLEGFLERRFQQAFDLMPDLTCSCSRFCAWLRVSRCACEMPRFQHVRYYKRRENYVIVSQPYFFEDFKLDGWCQEVGATYQIADEWGFYFPGWTHLFLVEFTLAAKRAWERTRRGGAAANSLQQATAGVPAAIRGFDGLWIGDGVGEVPVEAGVPAF